MNIMNRFTLQTLYKNKLRTLVTIIGIILSTAMFTGVTSIVTSLQQYLINLEINDNGRWEGRINTVSTDEAKAILKDKSIQSGISLDNIGYSILTGGANESKPYVCVESIPANTQKLISIKLTEGRMPANDGELVISSHIQTDGNVTYNVGDIITLNVGTRTVNGTTASQCVEYTKGAEKIENTVKKQYKIVGICERPSLENFSAPGYSVFTTGDTSAIQHDVFFTMKDSRKINQQIKNLLKKYTDKNSRELLIDNDYAIHKNLLRYMGTAEGGNYRTMLNTMAGALIFIIVLASVTLIYNAFSISVSERTKQFGLLKSIGATKKQIRHSVCFEALCLCVIGIPIGILSGLVGIGVTLHFVGKIIEPYLNNTKGVNLTLAISPAALLLSAVIAMITVLISASIPARKAVKLTAIDALRENHDIRIRSRKIRSPKWIYQVFGFEGMLANKNFKRNRRKYRLTVFSLAISVILFIGSASFIGYMTRSVDMSLQEMTADITLSVSNDDMNHQSAEKSYQKMRSLRAVDDASYSESAMNTYVILDKEQIDTSYYRFNKSGNNQNENTGFHAKNAGDKVIIPVKLSFIDDSSYQKYLEEHHLNVSKYMDTKKLCPLIWDESILCSKQTQKAKKFNILQNGFTPDKIYCIRNVSGYYYIENFTAIDLKRMEFPFAKGSEEYDYDAIKMMPEKQALESISLSDGKVVDTQDYKAPLGITAFEYADQITMTLPLSAKETMFRSVSFLDQYKFNFTAKDYNTAYTSISNYLRNDSGFAKSVANNLYSPRMNSDSIKVLLLILKIFTYGFIILISLIVIANIFNTISTNVMLRRKEFAMLKSVGMTLGGFDRMMNYECLLYGVKGILFGLPLAFLFNFAIYHSVLDAMDLGFQIPWGSVAIVVLGVFAVVFASMMYSMHKIKKDNPIEALKNDNI